MIKLRKQVLKLNASQIGLHSKTSELFFFLAWRDCPGSPAILGGGGGECVVLFC